MSDYGFKISLPTYDVNTATIDQLIFSSANPLLKIKVIDIGQIGTTGTTTIYNHGLGYSSQFRFFMQMQDINASPTTPVSITDFNEAPTTEDRDRSAHGDLTSIYEYLPSVDSSNLYLTINHVDYGALLRYFYVVYYDPQL